MAEEENPSKKRRHTETSDSGEDGAVELDIEVPSDDTAPNPSANKLAAELEKAKSDFLYLGAEFENYKKHAIKERSDLVRYGAERFVRDFLDVIDNFERALESTQATESAGKLREGVELIYREIQGLLTRHNVHEINPVGQAFDPNLHEAITIEPSETLAPGTVSRVFRKAYRLHDRLLRPAQVVVSRAPDQGGSKKE